MENKINLEIPLDVKILPSDWNYQVLGKLVDSNRGISYGVVQPGHPNSSGVPIIRVNNLKKGSIIIDDIRQVEREIESKYQRTRLCGGEILLSLVGTLGECAIVPSNLAGWNVARAVGVIPVLPDIDTKWIYYCLQTPQIQHYINIWATRTVQATFNLRDVARLPIPLPPLSEQKAIAHILSSLDDKIELNQQMNETLEAMDRAIFKSWFVDFDPVRAKMEGRQPAGMDAATADLFPDEFEESSFGLIPKGWKIGTLNDLGKIVTGKTPSTKVAEYFGGNVPFITPSDMDGKKMISRTDRYLTEDGVNAVKSAKIPAGTIIVSCIGSDMGKVTCAVQDSVTNQQINSIIANDYLREYIYYNLSQRKEELQNLAGGGSAVPILNKGHFSNVEILIPQSYLLKYFDQFSNTVATKIYENDEESHSLATIRDTLLPKLMSGEIRVKEAEKIIDNLS
jgi:type I restriction enzyme S subunit